MSERAMTSGFHRVALALAVLGSATTMGLVLMAVGQPLFSDDTWWHLALGAAYAESGPWLAVDPLAFTTPAPPPPTSWLADLGLHFIWMLGGFSALRLVHVASVIGIFGLAWSILHKAGRSRIAASVLTAIFAAISAYRFVQLRPHLFSILAMLLLFRLLLQGPKRPSWMRVGLSVCVMGIWANVHPVYPIGVVLMGGAAAALLVAGRIRGGDAGAANWARGLRIGVASMLGLVATCVHPLGIEGYRKAFSVGSGGESLAVVVDEWGAFEPFVWPVTTSPPSVLSWIAIWCLLVATPIFALRTILRWFRSSGELAAEPDPVWVPLALASLVAMLAASRFSWLSVFPLALLVAAIGPRVERRGVIAAFVGIGLALPLVFMRLGDWPAITRGLPPNLVGYRIPYAAGKYHLPAVWFLADTRLEGNLFGRYSEGGFQSFWLGPRIRTAMNGALNMPPDALAASFALRERIGTPTHPRFEDALDAMGVDLFMGTGLAMNPRPGRPPNYSTNYLESVPGWLLIFRNLDSAVYLRLNARNGENLDRVVDYYAAAGVPFDRVAGFDAGLVLQRAPGWAIAKGLSTPAIRGSMSGAISERRVGMIASTYLALGMYAEAAAANDALLRSSPGDRAALERRLWLELRPGQSVDAARFAESIRALSLVSPQSPVAAELLTLARDVRAGNDLSAGRLWRRAIFSRADAQALLRTVQPPEIRSE